VYIVTPTGGEFVILLNTSGSMDPATIVMDSNLNVIETYTLAQLTGWGVTPGGALLTDAAGNVAFSNGWFSAAELASSNNPGPSGGTVLLNGPGFSSPASSNNDVSFQAAGGNLNYSQYTSLWGPNPGLVTVNGAVTGNYNVVAAYNVDDTPGAGEVVLVLSDMGNNMYFVAIPLVNILSGTVTPGPLFGNYPYITLSNDSNSSVGFAGDSLVVYNYNSNSLVRYSAKPPFNQLSSLSLGNNSGKNNGNLQYAYKMTGGYSVVYDQVGRKLTKVANWW
jgi:hypothetical protein